MTRHTFDDTKKGILTIDAWSVIPSKFKVIYMYMYGEIIMVDILKKTLEEATRKFEISQFTRECQETVSMAFDPISMFALDM